MINKVIKEKEVTVKKKVTQYECTVCRREFSNKEVAERHRSLHMPLTEAFTLLASGSTLCIYPGDRYDDCSSETLFKPKIFVKLEDDILRFLAGVFWSDKPKADMLEEFFSSKRRCEVLKGKKLLEEHQHVLDVYGSRGKDDVRYYNR
jgi:hypothetical protein